MRGSPSHVLSCSSRSSGNLRPAFDACCPRMLGGDRGRGRARGVPCRSRPPWYRTPSPETRSTPQPS
eukprot:6936224-Pyramimonas_sp.AAC.1